MPDRALAAPVVDALFATAPVGLALWDAELRFVRVNDRFAAMSGLAAEDCIGRPVAGLLPELAGDLLEVRGRAEPVLGRDLTVSGPEGLAFLRASCYPVLAGDGQLAGVGAVVLELTELRLAGRRLRLLADVGRLLTGALEVERSLQAVAELVVAEGLADACAIELLHGPRLHPVAAAGPGPAPHELTEQVLAAGEPLVATGEDLALLAATGIARATVVALPGRGAPLGTLTLAHRLPGASGEGLELAQELAERCALAVEAARLYTERDELARVFQEHLRPQRLPDIPGASVSGIYQTGGDGLEVGGDFYDVFRVGTGWRLVLGDVVGKGPRAAVVTGQVRHTLRAVANHVLSLSAALATVNGALLAADEDEGCFCTLVAADLEPLSSGGWRVGVVRAGHPPPLLRSADGAVDEVGDAGLPLGVVADVSYREAERQLTRGELLLFYTDGVTEARRRNELFGEDRLRALMVAEGGPNEVLERIMGAVDGFRAERPRDDVAMLAAQVEG